MQARDVDPSERWPDGRDCRENRRHPTDLTDDERERVRPLLPPVSKRGHKSKVDMREMLNAVRYMIRSGGGWRTLPTNFGLLQTVYW